MHFQSEIPLNPPAPEGHQLNFPVFIPIDAFSKKILDFYLNIKSSRISRLKHSCGVQISFYSERFLSKVFYWIQQANRCKGLLLEKVLVNFLYIFVPANALCISIPLLVAIFSKLFMYGYASLSLFSKLCFVIRPSFTFSNKTDRIGNLLGPECTYTIPGPTFLCYETRLFIRCTNSGSLLTLTVCGISRSVVIMTKFRRPSTLKVSLKTLSCSSCLSKKSKSKARTHGF